MRLRILFGSAIPSQKTAESWIDEGGKPITIARTSVVRDLIMGRQIDPFVVEAKTPRQGAFVQVESRREAQKAFPRTYLYDFDEWRAWPNVKKSAQKKFKAKHWRRNDWVVIDGGGRLDDFVSSVLDAGDDEFATLCQMGCADIAIALNY